jgi:hypothetical protein
MTPFNAGDVVSVEFPFSDLQTLKRRPGLVLADGEMDLLVARASTIRLTKLATIDQRLVHHKIDVCIGTTAGRSWRLGS